MLRQTKGLGSATGSRRRRSTSPRSKLLPAFVLAVAVFVLTLGPATAARQGAGADRQLVVDTQYDQQTADPARDASISGRYILGSVYDTLTSFKAKQVNGKLTVSLSKPVPWLATSWKSNPAGTVWTFNLRQGVKFSNGDPLTAADVVFSLLRVKNVNAAPAFITASFKSVKAVGDSTVVITTKQPNPAVPYLVAYKSTGVIDSKVAKENGATDAADAAKTDKAQKWFDSNSIGSGPYTFQSFSTTDQTVLVANPNFWGKKPAYDQIVFRNVKPEIARLDVQSGQAQVALGLTPNQADSISGNTKIYKAPSTTVYYLQANANPSVSALASNRHLWQAIRYALDYAEPRPPRRRRCRPGVRRRSAPVPGRPAGGGVREAEHREGQVRARGGRRLEPVADPRVPVRLHARGRVVHDDGAGGPVRPEEDRPRRHPAGSAARDVAAALDEGHPAAEPGRARSALPRSEHDGGVPPDRVSRRLRRLQADGCPAADGARVAGATGDQPDEAGGALP